MQSAGTVFNTTLLKTSCMVILTNKESHKFC